jgi:cytochrome b involved in lipid metabolism
MPTVEEITTFTVEEVSKHKSKDSPYLIIHGKVYDVAKFVEEVTGH